MVDYTDGSENISIGGSVGETFNALGGIDSIILDSGAFDIPFRHMNNIVNGGDGGDTLLSNNGLGGDTLNGQDGDDLLSASAPGTKLNGGAGNDDLLGFGIGIIMAGGTGNDTYTFNQGLAPDSIVEAANAGLDTIKVQAATDFGLEGYDNIENLIAEALENKEGQKLSLSLSGNAHNNRITGDDGADFLSGGAGNDTLDGGLGLDTLTGGIGNDVYLVTGDAEENDTVVEDLNAGIDLVFAYVDTYFLADNVENVKGVGNTAKFLRGNDLNNTFFSIGRNDTFVGGIGNDTYEVLGGETVTEVAGEGTDTVKAFVASYTLGSEIENLIGTSSSLQRLTGNSAKNILTGGSGKDVMIGAGGADTFDFNAVSDTGITFHARDIIIDFVHGVDEINFATIDASASAAGNNAFSFIGMRAFTEQAGQLRYRQWNADGEANDRTIVSADVDGDGLADFRINLKGLVKLTADDFVL
jgi:Ca2+-binding RTX toxin-like protein